MPLDTLRPEAFRALAHRNRLPVLMGLARPGPVFARLSEDHTLVLYLF